MAPSLLLLLLLLPRLAVRVVPPRPRRLPLIPRRGRRVCRAGRVRPSGRAAVVRGLGVRCGKRRSGSRVEKGEGVWLQLLLLLLGKLWRRRLNE